MNINTYLGRYILNPFKVLADANVSVTVAPASIDGQALTAGDRVFLSAQSTASQNGGWVFASAGAAMTRTDDLPVGATVKSGTVFMCNAGTVYGDKFIVVFSASDIPIIIGTTAISVGVIGGGSSFNDSAFNIYDNVDDSKIAVFQASGITTATTRTFTFPDASGTIALVASTEVPLTFSTGLTRTTNTITANLSTGKAGGQSVIGGTAASETLTLSSTTHATKGRILFGTSAYDEVNNRLGIGIASSLLARVHGVGSGATTATISLLLENSGGDDTFRVYDSGQHIWAGSSATGNLFFGNLNGLNITTATGNSGFGVTVFEDLTEGLVNSAFGYQSLRNLTIGDNNSAFGSETLFTATTADNCSAFGATALKFNISGEFNCAFGVGALRTNTAAENSAFGGQALLDNTTGTKNSALGLNALRYNTTGSNHTAIGWQALFNNLTGTQSTVVGSESFTTNTTGDGLVGLGYRAGYWETGSDKLFIDNRQRDSEADGRAKALIYGVFAATTAAQRLTINGSLIGGSAALATTATDNFWYVPSCAGVPTGVPTAQTGTIPMVADSTNNKLYIYSGGSWVALN